MTVPANPAPADADAGKTPAPETPAPEPAATEPTPDAPKTGDDAKASPWDDPAVARAEIEKLRRENAKARTEAKATAAQEAKQALAQDIGKALGLVQEDAPLDPAELTKKLTAKEAETQEARTQLAVFQNASATGADPAALLDSSSFLAKAKGIDPTDSSAMQQAIKEAVEANPRLAAQEQGKRLPSYSPAGDVNTKVPTKPVQLTRQDIQRMDPKQIVKAKAEGQLHDLLSGPNR